MTGHSLSLLGSCELGGRNDVVQVQYHKATAYVGHAASQRFSVVDVRDPATPRPLAAVPAAPGTRTMHLQAADNLLLVACSIPHTSDAAYFHRSLRGGLTDRSTLSTGSSDVFGLAVYDISAPEPRKIGHFSHRGASVHRVWYEGGRWAYLSALLPGLSDYCLLIVDMADPARPQPVGEWWIPGMNEGAGEQPQWDPGRRRVGLHHAVVRGDIAYGAWRDGGLTVLDVRDRTRPSLLCHRTWSPPFPGGTHTALPLSRDLLVVADEPVPSIPQTEPQHIWLFDTRQVSNPVSISTFPVVSGPLGVPHGKVGPHNLFEPRPGLWQSDDYVFATQHTAGVYVYDVTDPYRPTEAACFVSTPGTGPLADLGCVDVTVNSEGVVFITDAGNGLRVCEFI